MPLLLLPLMVATCSTRSHWLTMLGYSQPTATLSRNERYARRLLLSLYHAARWLSLMTCRLAAARLQLAVQQQRRRNKALLLIWRIIIVLIYSGVVPSLFERFLHSDNSYANLVAVLQSASVSLFAIATFIMQTKGEPQFIGLINHYMQLYERILSCTKTNELFPLQFLVLYALKLLFTLCGCLHELMPLLHVEHALDLLHQLSIIVGMYMWLGTLLVLDACFLGFLVAAVMYERMAAHISQLLLAMEPIELGQPVSQYKRMRLLCDFADELDTCTAIYHELYQLNCKFCAICQWQILFYIYYNFIIILLLLYECIWRFLKQQEIVLVSLLMVGIKLANLALLIMCADYMVKTAQQPERLPLDIVCTDMDQRWDRSVEAFLSQQKTKYLEVKVLGIFQLNNEFILIILSGIVTYLFILVQFGMTDGFEEKELLKERLQ